MYIADGTNIRAVDPKGTIHTLIGHHGHQNRWSPVPCRGAARAMQVQLQWPTALALNPLDGSLYFVDDRLVLKLTSDMKVKVIAGIPLHCNEDHLAGMNRTAPAEEPLGTVLAMAFGPNGDLYVADTNSKRINTIKVIESSTGFMKHQECDCQGKTLNYSRRKPANGTNGGQSPSSTDRGAVGPDGSGSPFCVCQHANDTASGRKEYPDTASAFGTASNGGAAGETILSSNIRFQSISAIAVAQDGVINVADQGSLRIFALEHYLPQHDSNGEFQIPYTPLNELYVFNRYGQHIATRDLSTGKSRYSFLYSKNTSFGKLSTVTDSSGNKIQFLRDYSNVVSSIENGQDYKTELKISPSGLLTKVSARSGGGRKVEVLLDYDGLSNVKFNYEYDDHFRLASIGGRIGGQNLPQQSFGYDERTGRLATIGQFEVMRGGDRQINATTVSDRTGTFMRTVNGRFLLMQLTLTIHRMEVFRMEFAHDLHGRIVQTRTYTRNVGVNTYTNVKNFTWDCDGQLVGVEAQEPWGFRYDDNGNMLSLTYRGNTIPMEYNAQDRIVKFGEGQYKYEPRGLVAQNAREERFHYNAKGLLIRATKRGRFDIRYFYDHLNRLITRKDNFGNVTQFFYTNQRRHSEISHIYSPRDGKLMSLTYDDRGSLIYAQVYRYRYYIATDQCGTPVMIFNQYGEGIREIMRSPYGHIVTSLVHMPDGKVYDPLIGQWMTPHWEHVDQRIRKPTKLHLYRYNGNDPINPPRQLQDHPRDHLDWLQLMGYDLDNMIPQASIASRASTCTTSTAIPELLEDPFNVRFTKKKVNQSRKRKRRDATDDDGPAGEV
uniref:Tox-GHH domain-containing protein n=1 Tax=Anopheles coluzzii TaxID=1518534 RepID=A0A8W7P5S7_ANOCL